MCSSLGVTSLPSSHQGPETGRFGHSRYTDDPCARNPKPGLPQEINKSYQPESLDQFMLDSTRPLPNQRASVSCVARVSPPPAITGSYNPLLHMWKDKPCSPSFDVRDGSNLGGKAQVAVTRQTNNPERQGTFNPLTHTWKTQVDSAHANRESQPRNVTKHECSARVGELNRTFDSWSKPPKDTAFAVDHTTGGGRPGSHICGGWSRPDRGLRTNVDHPALSTNLAKVCEPRAAPNGQEMQRDLEEFDFFTG
ncbi:hypothetical protein CYMTET_17409 [Cymbomonas tetramitiformis]|uniref:Uncharacterized protein n=1 Tax=Cymbomonas tetramitiformis TaxID=36881 RepID=A0AAE0L6Z6_9CHLO|nr:hypothetical protein CYMTET_17409 [Cymbomonas tetramitiformis]